MSNSTESHLTKIYPTPQTLEHFTNENLELSTSSPPRTMPPPLLRRSISNPSPLFSSSFLTRFPSSPHLRTVSTKRKWRKQVLVQLTKNVPKLGLRGDVVTVKHGRMRNILYPYSMAQYIHPGKDSFLTPEKLSIPVQPGYKAMLRRMFPDPSLQEFQQLFKQTRERLIKQERRRPNVNARDRVLSQIQQFRILVRESRKWNPDQKRELKQFLGIQAASWRLLGDEYWKTEIGRAKETMLFSTWRKFTTGMGNAAPGKKAMRKVVVTTVKKSPTTEKSKKRKGITKSELRKMRQRKAALKRLAAEKTAGTTTGEKVTTTLKKKSPGKRPVKKVGRRNKKLKDVTLEREPSTSGTIVQADVKTIKRGIETPIGSKKVVGQTVVHPKSKSIKAGKKHMKHKTAK